MNARKRRLLNKRIKPKTYIFSYWFRRTGEDWQQHTQTFSSRMPPFYRALIPVSYGPDVAWPRLEAAA
jgi:hypothetical protein